MTPSPPIAVRPEEWLILTDILDRHVPRCEVWAFGSRARGAANPYSDLDLAIVAEPGLGLERLAEIREALSDSDLPWKVDLIDWANTGEEFRRLIAAHKVLVKSREAS